MTVLTCKFINDELVKHPLDVLEVGHVTTGADDSVWADRVETGYILEAGERAE